MDGVVEGEGVDGVAATVAVDMAAVEVVLVTAAVVLADAVRALRDMADPTTPPDTRTRLLTTAPSTA